MKYKQTILVGIPIFLICLTLSIVLISNTTSHKVEPEEPSCDSFGAIYLRESESHLKSDMSSLAGIGIVPKNNEMIAQINIMKCDSFNYKNYIKFDKDEEFSQEDLENYLKSSDYNLTN